MMTVGSIAHVQWMVSSCWVSVIIIIGAGTGLWIRIIPWESMWEGR